MTKEML